jgi:hypothetical protein
MANIDRTMTEIRMNRIEARGKFVTTLIMQEKRKFCTEIAFQ